MKRICLLLAVCGLVFLSGMRAHADQPAVLERPAQLLIQDALLTLWSLGLTGNAKLAQVDLSRNALFFLVLSDEVNSVLYREGNAELFRRIPQPYSGYVRKELVEQVAVRVFGQKLHQHYAPGGTIFNGKGYFVDLGALGRPDASFSGLDSDDLLPGFAEFEVVELEADGSWTLFGRMFRFKMVEGAEILWREATVQATIIYDGRNWVISRFQFEEQGMG